MSVCVCPGKTTPRKVPKVVLYAIVPNPCAMRRSILQPPRRKMLPPVIDPTDCNYIEATLAAKAGKPGCKPCHTAGIECPCCICCPCCGRCGP